MYEKNSPAKFLMIVSTSLVAAYLLHHFVELPAIKHTLGWIRGLLPSGALLRGELNKENRIYHLILLRGQARYQLTNFAPLIILGDISYSLYLVHPLVMHLMAANCITKG
jgi:peptidoglycan/LPS O-acetylase OafA/YrhL